MSSGTFDSQTPEYSFLVVELDVSEEQVSQYEWIEERKGYREWLIPAALINAKAKVRIVEEPE
jgi:hypothetical protein